MSKFSTGAVRDSMRGKGSPSLMPTSALRAIACRFEDGASKYGRDNWRKGIPTSRYIDGIYRHLWGFMEGEISEDHLSAVLWNAACLYETIEMIKNKDLPEELNGHLNNKLR